MTVQSVIRGLLYPAEPAFTSGSLSSSPGTIDAATEKVAWIGRIQIEGRATSKVISAAGGGSIIWRAVAVTFANGSTTLDVGLQDVDLTTGNPPRPDGTFDVKRTLTGGVDTISGGALQTTAMTGGSGSKTLSHNDWIAVVFDMTARAGSDSVAIGGVQFGGGNLPFGALFTASWVASTGSWPQVGIVFDDGTRGTLDGCPVIMSSLTTEAFADATNPDERGNLFVPPWDCKVDAVFGYFGGAAANGDFEIQIYSDPLGTPTSVLPGGTAITVTAETLLGYASRPTTIPLPSEVSLTHGVTYAVAIKATGAGNVSMTQIMNFDNAAWKQFHPGGAGTSKVTRNGGSGAFTESDTIIYQLGVRISGFQDTSSGSGGGASFSAYAM